MSEEPRSDRPGASPVRPLLMAAGAAQLALGVFIVVAPQDFYDSVASFPPYNAHFLRDIATLYLALGAVMVVASGRRAWQVPVLVFAVVQYALHTINHVVDVGDAEPNWVGSLNLVVLALLTGALWWLLRAADRVRRR